jgi:pimeloyl-ACP methyl ester carboxylesterase
MFEKKPETIREPVKKYADNDMSIEAQFSRSKILEINGADVETVLITPENPITNVPLVVLPGWSATMESFKPGIEEAAKEGRPVASLNFPREGGEVPDIYNHDVAEWYDQKGLQHPEWATEFKRQANTVFGFLQEENIEKADVIAHSMACPSVCLAAMLHPEKFEGRTIFLTDPVGFIGKDTLLRLAKDAPTTKSRTPTMSEIKDADGKMKPTFPEVTPEETEYINSTKHIQGEYLKGKRLWRGGMEVLDIVGSKIDENILLYLKEKGVKIIVVAAVEDTMFPMNKMQENEDLNKDSVAGFVSTIGGHMQTQVHGAKFFKAILSMLPKPEAEEK